MDELIVSCEKLAKLVCLGVGVVIIVVLTTVLITILIKEVIGFIKE